MKRSKQVSHAAQPRSLSTAQLKGAKGGATMVEYALLIQAAPVEANAWISWD